MKPRITLLAAAMLATLVPALACTLMKPSHEELSGGSQATPGADAAADALPDAVEDAASEQSIVSESGSDGDAALEADVALDVATDAKPEAEAGLSCEAGTTACGNQCVEATDPSYGCGSADCLPCALANADAGCGLSGCTLLNCAEGFSDCDDAGQTGCEIDLQNDPHNCAACGAACTTLPNMVGPCTAGTCGPAACVPGYQDCNALLSDGCELHTDVDPQNCGTCANVCPSGANSIPACASGQCGLECLSGFDDCNGLAADGCEVHTEVDIGNCGVCGKSCSYAHALPTCVAGVCHLGTCAPLWGNCNGSAADGCETGLAIDKQNCGECNLVCIGGKKCINGQCV